MLEDELLSSNTGEAPFRVNRVASTVEQQCLLHPQEQTLATLLSTSEKCHERSVAGAPVTFA
jgi:hypothetical protein